LENAEVMRGVTGVYDMAPDARPLLGEIPWVAGLHVCAGFSRHGIQDFPGNRARDVRAVARRQGKTVDINSFRPCRFTQGQPIKAEYEYVDD
jgi:sarcosine oxidase subunit beta